MKNIVAKLTIRQLKLNFRRTIITIIGIALSVTMLTATSSVVTSFLDGAKRDEIAQEGEWHTRINNMPMKNTDKIKEKIPNVEDVFFIETEGFAPIPQKGNKRFLFIENYGKNAFDRFPITLSQGRLPQKDGELIISEEAVKAGYKVGQTFTLELGYRGVLFKPDKNGDVIETVNRLGFTDRYYNDNETHYEEKFYPENSKTYTIVGFFSDRARYRTIQYPEAPAYEAISFLDVSTIKADDTVSPLIVFNKLNTDIYENTEKGAKALGGENYSRHSFLLQYYGLSSRAGVTTAIYAFAAVLVIIILIGSVAFIYNAFSISLADRSKYLGLLACVGATKKQKRYSVMLEGIILGAIAIPIGLLAGLGGIAVTLKLVNPYIQQLMMSNIEFYLVVSPVTIIASVLLGILTIFLSLLRPMKNAAKTSPIETVRRTNDISVSQKQIKTSRLTKKIFGFEGTLAMKNIKRNPGRYRVTIASLTVSVVLFLVTITAVGLANSAFINEIGYNEESHNVSITFEEHDQDISAKEKAAKDIFNELAKNIDTEWITLQESLFGTPISAVVSSDNISNNESAGDAKEHIASIDGKDQLMSVKIFTTQTKSRDNNKKSQMDKIGKDEALLLNMNTYRNVDEKTHKQTVVTDKVLKKTPDKIDLMFRENVDAASEALKNSPYKINLKSKFFNPDTNKTTESDWYGIPLCSVKIGGETKEHFATFSEEGYQFSLIVQPETFREIAQNAEKVTSNPILRYQKIYLKTDNADEALRIAKEITDKSGVNFYAANAEADLKEAENMITLISVFSGGFITLMILICIANIFNTVSTGIMLRRREFAMLKSTGMTPKAFNRMIKYESLFYAFKALLYGVPISMAVTLILVLVIRDVFKTTFFATFPWLALIIAAVSILVLVGSTAFYALRRIDKESIMDVLKDENT